MNNEKIFVSEDDKEIINKWYKDARAVNRETLSEFISNIMDKYEFDYASYVHAVTACSIATAYACGCQLSGFQGSFVGLQFIKEWTYPNNVSGISIRNWDNMLYPQYEFQFEKTIPQQIWNNLKEEAEKRLNYYAGPNVVRHLEAIANGEVPFGYTISKD